MSNKKYKTAVGVINASGPEEKRMYKAMQLLDFACKNQIQVKEIFIGRDDAPTVNKDLHKIIEYIQDEPVDILLIGSIYDLTQDADRYKEINKLLALYNVTIIDVKAGCEVTPEDVDFAKSIINKIEQERMRGPFYV